ncbi:hypothetical protein L1987_62859 [Smallanthus sonchifolius]|uniref:Uncharacterized protein n=3 Tax=Smallanthus sonchifolius TaxID=185202 RepID=A0ACB9CBS0_9ASTR|nr:hypothetical protein L1987_62855 [Smallanthus sonchifolius]KAI3731668.1 hypothetical protein L1987_62857 [Smallanthus sonchifolius]KAI3731670.1 hypothetical protein L1987_62859 [Smallanthus sonchifolius]
MTTWSELPPEILNTIAGKLHFFEDYINFLCVCTSWNKSSTTTTKNMIQHLPSQFPMLMFAESNTTEDFKHRTFFLLSNGGTMRKLPLPEAHRQRCISTHGWLLTIGEQEFYTKLVNPLSHTQIELPELYMFEELYFDRDEWVYYGFCMRKAVFTSSNPLSDPSFRVIIIWGKSIGFCRPGDGSWTRIDGWEGSLFDIVYHRMRKRLYVVATMGTIYECDIVNDVLGPVTLTRLTNFPGKELGCSCVSWAYLLEWGHDSLLMVVRERHYFKKQDDEYGRYGPYRTSRFQCFVYGLDDGKWSKSASLGDNAVFVGFNSSFAIDGGEAVEPNCIYFTDDLYEPYRGLPDGGGGDVGVYHMADGRIESVFDSQESVFRGSPPLWLQPSSLPVIKGMK